MFIADIESQMVYLDGLDATKHLQTLDQFCEKGWTVCFGRPNIEDMKFEYLLKRQVA